MLIFGHQAEVPPRGWFGDDKLLDLFRSNKDLDIKITSGKISSGVRHGPPGPGASL